jgi:hypothetical protein
MVEPKLVDALVNLLQTCTWLIIAIAFAICMRACL